MAMWNETSLDITFEDEKDHSDEVKSCFSMTTLEDEPSMLIYNKSFSQSGNSYHIEYHERGYFDYSEMLRKARDLAAELPHSPFSLSVGVFNEGSGGNYHDEISATYMYRIRGTWAKRGSDEIIVFNLVNATPAVLVAADKEDSTVRRRVSLTPDEWIDDFGEEFYEHTLDNGFFYLMPDTEWNAQAASIPAPGIAQMSVPSTEELQMSIELLMKGVSSNE